MTRTVALAAALLLGTASVLTLPATGSAPDAGPAITVTATPSAAAQLGGAFEFGTLAPEAVSFSLASETYDESCCKVCRRGKACGDSCISRSYTCRQPPGCACNG